MEIEKQHYFVEDRCDRLATDDETYQLVERLDDQISDLAESCVGSNDEKLISEIAAAVLKLTQVKRKLLDAMGLHSIVNSEKETIWVANEK